MRTHIPSHQPSRAGGRENTPYQLYRATRGPGGTPQEPAEGPDEASGLHRNRREGKAPSRGARRGRQAKPQRRAGGDCERTPSRLRARTSGTATQVPSRSRRTPRRTRVLAVLKPGVLAALEPGTDASEPLPLIHISEPSRLLCSSYAFFPLNKKLSTPSFTPLVLPRRHPLFSSCFPVPVS